MKFMFSFSRKVLDKHCDHQMMNATSNKKDNIQIISTVMLDSTNETVLILTVVSMLIL